MKRHQLIFIGLAVFLLTALLQWPATRLHGLFATGLSQSRVQLQSLSGDLSSGRVAQVSIRGQAVVRDLGWTLQAWRLLLGRASVHLSGGSDGTLIDGTAYVVPSGTLTFSDFQISAALKSVLAVAGQANLPVEGQLAADIDTFKLRKGWPTRADGLVTVRGMGWKLGREPVLLGDYEALVENETAGIKATIRTLAGSLEVSGEARADEDRNYELHLQMRPKPDAPPLVMNLVRNLGQPDNQGWYHLRRRGQAATSSAPAPESAAP